jgi:hypothetical protein
VTYTLARLATPPVGQGFYSSPREGLAAYTAGYFYRLKQSFVASLKPLFSTLLLLGPPPQNYFTYFD